MSKYEIMEISNDNENELVMHIQETVPAGSGISSSQVHTRVLETTDLVTCEKFVRTIFHDIEAIETLIRLLNE